MSVVFKNARIFDGQSEALSDASSVVIADGRIKELGKVKEPAGAEVIDLKGRVLMPGLIDAHFHAYAVDANIPRLETLPLSYIAHRARGILEGALHRGFTTVRDAGGADYGLFRALEEGHIEGPRLFYSGRALSQTGGHGDSRLPYAAPCTCRSVANLSEVADGVEQVRLAARHSLRAGAHQIKIFVSGGISSPSDPIWMTQYSEDEIRAAVGEAQSRRTYVMAHAYAGDAITRAVRCGVRTIEHGNLLDKDAAAEMAKAGAFLIPTLVTYDALAKASQGTVPEVTLAKLKDVHKLGREAVVLARQAGVAIGFGTDLLGDMHAQQLSEFRLRAEVDQPVDILRSATTVNAQVLQQSGELGTISIGAHADLIVIDGDPLKDISLMWRDGGIALVMKAGSVIRNDLAAL